MDQDLSPAGTLPAMPDAESVTPKPSPSGCSANLSAKGSSTRRKTVVSISDKFGNEFTYTNENGNPAIDRRVLKEFRKLTGDTVAWDRWEFAWRKRTADDAPARKQE